MAIYGNPVGGALNAKTFMLEVNGGKTEIAATVVGEQTVFDATENDVRKGMTFASSNGVKIGQKNIPAYETRMSYFVVEPNESCSIPLSDEDRYAYTKFQCIIVVYSSDYSSNVTTKYVSMNDGLFSVETSSKVSNITKNSKTKSIDLNMTNNSSDVYEIIYFTYKEV